MLTFKTFNLTPEQIELISVYRNKWKLIARSNQKIDRERAKLAVNNAYNFIDLEYPNVIFVSTPLEALNYIHRELNTSWGKPVNSSLGRPVAGKLIESLLDNIRNSINDELLRQLEGNLDDGLADRLALKTAKNLAGNNLFSIVWCNTGDMMMASSQNSDADDFTKAIFKLFWEAGFIFNNYISFPLWQAQKQIESLMFGKNNQDENFNQMIAVLFTGNMQQPNKTKYQLPIIDMSSRFANVFVPSVMADFAYYIDYCHNILDCPLDRDKWIIFNELITNCGWIFPYEKTVLVCDRQI